MSYLLYYNHVEDLTENRDSLNKYTMSLFLENVVSLNTDISQVRLTPISQNTFLNQKSYLLSINKENLPVKTSLCFLPFFGSRCSANFEEMNENADKTLFRVLNDP